MGEDLKFEPEAIHHSIAVFDAYFSINQIEAHLAGLKLTEGKSYEQVVQLVAVVCMLISAKFLEKTYPGVQKLN
jgi:Cyclin, N-terminal domain